MRTAQRRWYGLACCLLVAVQFPVLASVERADTETADELQQRLDEVRRANQTVRAENEALRAKLGALEAQTRELKEQVRKVEPALADLPDTPALGSVPDGLTGRAVLPWVLLAVAFAAVAAVVARVLRRRHGGPAARGAGQG